MTANDNRLCPSRYETGNSLADDGLTEYSTSQDVTDGTIWRQPHLLQLKF